MTDVTFTAEAIERAADELEHAAKELRGRAARMRQSGDLMYSAEAISTIQNLMASIRLDLFVARPIRALTKTHSD